LFGGTDGNLEKPQSMQQILRPSLDSRPPADKYNGVSFFVIETNKPIFIVKHVFVPRTCKIPVKDYKIDTKT
jgi:hypothetical protein